MSYRSIVQMANSQSLLERVAACAAKEGEADPYGWAQGKRWQVAASTGWDADWDYAKNAETVNQNPDTGARDDVITDAKILSSVQNLRASQPA